MGFWNWGRPKKAPLAAAAAAAPSPLAPPTGPTAAEWKKQGNALLAQGRLEEAGACYREATRADPADAAALVNLGYVLCEQGQAVAARSALEQSLQLDPAGVDAHFMLATLAQNRDDMPQAVVHLRELIRLQPGFDFMTDVSFGGEDGYAKTAARYEAILAIAPHNVRAHWGLGMTRLLLGDYERGWAGWEWRLEADAGKHPSGLASAAVAGPRWSGTEAVNGKTVLLHSEYGYGDTLQFCRYACDVARLGAHVVLQVQRGLASLLSSLDGDIRVIEAGTPLPEFDFHCPLTSLPLVLRLYREDTLRNSAYLQAAPDKLDHWRRRLNDWGLADPLRIGIVCSGNPEHVRDADRSMAMAELLSALPAGMRAVCLQPQLRPADLAALQADGRVAFPGSELSDFNATAALVSALDLVISVDTSVVHLAGALGKPVWVLLPRAPDWRWLLQREDSPWYSGARLFRQQRDGDWSGPLQQVRQELLALRPVSPAH